jgi:hypothetical protein
MARFLPRQVGLFYFGSAQQSDERRILSGFPESDEFGLGGGLSFAKIRSPERC